MEKFTFDFRTLDRTCDETAHKHVILPLVRSRPCSTYVSQICLINGYSQSHMISLCSLRVLIILEILRVHFLLQFCFCLINNVFKTLFQAKKKNNFKTCQRALCLLLMFKLAFSFASRLCHSLTILLCSSVGEEPIILISTKKTTRHSCSLK